MDRLTKEQRHKNMQANKSRGTKIELLLARVMWNAGIRYRKNDKGVYGTPDFSIRGHRIAIFCDGEFWHGRDWEENKEKIKSNRNFWYPKIERNIRHDREVTLHLEAEGWKVFRFWETDIRKAPDQCAQQVLAYLRKQAAWKADIRPNELTLNGKMSILPYPATDSATGQALPFPPEMAVVSHFLHNQTTGTAQPFESAAKDIITRLYDLNPDASDVEQLVAEPEIQYALGTNLNTAPFLPKAPVRFTFTELYAGIGSFRMALQRLGGRCIYCSEWNPEAQLTYLLNYGEVPFSPSDESDILQYLPADFDLLCAPIPGQKFSLASKKSDVERTRGTRFYEFVHILQARQPSAFLIETDGTIHLHDKGSTLPLMLKILSETAGYTLPDPQVLNARDFGLPQDVAHTYLVGFRKDLGLSASDFHYPQSQAPACTFADIQEPTPVATRYYLSDKVLDTLTQRKALTATSTRRWKYEATTHGGILHVQCGNTLRHQNNFVIDHRLKDFTAIPPYRGTVNRKGIRRLTPREFARLQGFPDEFILQLPETSLYHILEQASPVTVLEALGKELIKLLPGTRKNA